MLLPAGLIPATLIRRLNRFAVEVELEGHPLAAHLPNSGRVRELLQPGTPALLVSRSGSRRKTAFDLLLVRLGPTWVSADARLPNALVREALAEGRLEPFRRYAEVRPEARFGGSRVDFLLRGREGDCLLEVKSVTLVEAGVALFPDAPTARGTCHLRELTEARRQGLAAAVLFVVQRRDGGAFSPNDPADPSFGRILREAAQKGVQVLAYRCRVSPREIRIAGSIPVRL